MIRRILTHPITTAVEYTAAAIFTGLYVIASLGPKYDEIFGLILFTFFLGVGALFVSLTNPRPVMNTAVFTTLCFAGWAGCVWMLHREYGYCMTDIPALWIGALISAIAYLLLRLVNGLMGAILQKAGNGQQSPADDVLKAAPEE